MDKQQKRINDIVQQSLPELATYAATTSQPTLKKLWDDYVRAYINCATTNQKQRDKYWHTYLSLKEELENLEVSKKLKK